MKYLIKNRCVNADQIVMAEYMPEHPALLQTKNHPTRCNVTLTSIAAGELDQVATNEHLDLIGEEADRFWDYYIRDALTVVSP